MVNENLKKDWHDQVLPLIKSGVTIKVHQIIKEKGAKGEEKQRIQIFEGIVLARRGGAGKSATITVRKIASGGVGVERIFPIWSPIIAKIDLVKEAKVRRSKLYYLKNYRKKLSEKIISSK